MRITNSAQVLKEPSKSWILHLDAGFRAHAFFFIPPTTTVTTIFYVSVPTITITITITTTAAANLMVTPMYAPVIFLLFLETRNLQILFLCQAISIWGLLAVKKLMVLPLCKFCSNPVLLCSSNIILSFILHTWLFLWTEEVPFAPKQLVLVPIRELMILNLNDYQWDTDTPLLFLN